LQAKNEAVLAAARLLPTLQNYLTSANDFERTLRENLASKTASSYEGRLMNLQNICQWSPAEVLPLITLPSDVAYHLEHVRAILPYQAAKFNSDLSKSAEYEPISSKVSYDWELMKKAILSYLEEARETTARVEIVMIECKKIIPSSPLARSA
jgi:hypothetical protein